MCIQKYFKAEFKLEQRSDLICMEFRKPLIECVSVESNVQGFILYHVELADKHLGEGRIHQVAVGLGDSGRWLSQCHWRLQLERGSGGGEELGGSGHVIHQSLILLL